MTKKPTGRGEMVLEMDMTSGKPKMTCCWTRCDLCDRKIRADTQEAVMAKVKSHVQTKCTVAEFLNACQKIKPDITMDEIADMMEA